jgi:hypothetical protein
MISYYNLLLIISSVLTGLADGETIVEEIRAVLGRRGVPYPYFVEYDLALPAQPRPTGGTESHRHFAEAPDRLYRGEARETFTEKILLGPKTLLFAYDEPGSHILCTGPADLAGKPPERWLAHHGFPLTTLEEFDRGLVDNLRGILAGSTVLRKEGAGDVLTYHLTTRIGLLTILIGPARVEVSRPAEGKTPAKVLFRYTHGNGKPSWIGEVAELSARFADPKAKVRQLTGEFTWMAAMNMPDPGFDAIVKVLDGTESVNLARRHGYLVPDPATAKVVEAYAMSGQLHFRLEIDRVIYRISQYPQASRVGDSDKRKGLTKGRRKHGDYVVLDIVYPDVATNELHFIKDGATLIVVDPLGRMVDFEDRKIDRLIESFNAPKP